MNKWEQALTQYIDATNTHDFENVKKCLSKDAIYFFSNKTCNTMDEIQAFFENAWDTIKEEKYSANDVSWVSGEDMAYCLYNYHYEGYYNGEFTSGHGRATNVFVIEDGQVKLSHEHLSVGEK